MVTEGAPDPLPPPQEASTRADAVVANQLEISLLRNSRAPVQSLFILTSLGNLLGKPTLILKSAACNCLRSATIKSLRSVSASQGRVGKPESTSAFRNGG